MQEEGKWLIKLHRLVSAWQLLLETNKEAKLIQRHKASEKVVGEAGR